MTEFNSRNLYIKNCSDELVDVFNYIENSLSKDITPLNLNSEYFVLAVLEKKKSYAYKRLYACIRSVELLNLHDSLESRLMRKALSAPKPGVDINYNSSFLNIIKNAQEVEMVETNSNELCSDHILLSMLNENLDLPEKNLIKEALNTLGVNYTMLLDKINSEKMLSDDGTDDHKLDDVEDDSPFGFRSDGEDIENRDSIELIKLDGNNGAELISKILGDEAASKLGITGNKKTKKIKKDKLKYIPLYCTNLNDLVEKGEIDELVGREKEIEKIITTLGRRKKNNLILVGGEGVGKTAIAESIAYKIVNKQIPDFLSNKIVISLNMSALVSGTTFRGMIEERVQGIINEMKENGNFILFIDNIGNAFSKTKTDSDISSIFSNSLESGDIQVIGACDFKSFRNTFDKDPSLSRRFQKVIVDAPSTEECVEILMAIKKYYEKYHHVFYTEDAIKNCVYLCGKYITERNLPDSAIDIIDDAGSIISTNIKQDPEVLKIIDSIENTKKQMAIEKQNEEYQKFDELETKLKKLEKECAEKKNEYEERIANNPKEINTNDILNAISLKTGIPINKLSSDDKKKLAEINNRLKSEVIGQDDAIDTICKALKRGRIGLGTNKCMFSGILIGQTGVGKTLIAKKLAKEMFGDENALVRFDMSEFHDKTSVNKLIGSNPGYVGYEDGGLLTEAIKNRKYCVLLLDEIEKADPEVYNIFLQVLDEGFLTDNSGMRVDFKNVIVLFTSNVGTKAANDFGKGIGFDDNSSDKKKKILIKELKNKFPPEFLNRLNNIIYFNNLTDENLKSIITLELNKTKERIANIGFGLEVENEVVSKIFDVIKKQKEFGARPIARTIQDEIEDKLTDCLLEKDYDKNYIFKAYVENNTVKVR